MNIIYQIVPFTNIEPDYDHYFKELEIAVKTVIENEDRFVILQLESNDTINEGLIKALEDIWAIYKSELITQNGVYVGIGGLSNEDLANFKSIKKRCPQ